MQTLKVEKQIKGTLQGGFTLFELLIVISIMGTLLGIAMPSLNLNSDDKSFVEFEKMLESGVSEARYLAMITGKIQKLTFAEDGSINVIPSGLSEIGTLGDYELLSITKYDGESKDILFYPSGLAESSVICVSRDQEDMTFYIPPVTAIESKQGNESLESFQD